MILQSQTSICIYLSEEQKSTTAHGQHSELTQFFYALYWIPLMITWKHQAKIPLMNQEDDKTWIQIPSLGGRMLLWSGEKKDFFFLKTWKYFH